MRRAALLLVGCWALLAWAQDYPSRPLRVLLPNAPGSSIDTLGRIVAVRLGETLGQPLVIENRAGASGALGMEAGRNAAPDGYTLILASASNMVTAPLMQKSAPYDPLRDFSLLSTFAVMPNVLVVNPQLPVTSVRELIEHARAHRGQLNMASAGPGSASHLAGVLLQAMAGFDSVHVPYKGGSPAAASIVAGETHWYLTPAPNAMTLVKAGRLRALAHSLPQRSALLGDLPAIAETVPGYDTSGWAGFVGPKGLPAGMVEKFRGALLQSLGGLREQLGAQGAQVLTTTPEEFRAFLEREIASTVKAMQAAGVKPE